MGPVEKNVSNAEIGWDLSLYSWYDGGEPAVNGGDNAEGHGGQNCLPGLSLMYSLLEVKVLVLGVDVGLVIGEDV